MPSMMLNVQPACVAGRAAPAARGASCARLPKAPVTSRKTRMIARAAQTPPTEGEQPTRHVSLNEALKGNEMPLWQKVQSAPRDADGPVAQPVAEAVPDMSSVDPVAIEPASGPLWMKSHYKETTSMWQQVNAGREPAGVANAVAGSEDASGPVDLSGVPKGSAPLWSQVHTKKAGTMWQQVNATRDQSFVDLVPGAPPDPEPEVPAPKVLEIPPAQPPAWQKVHLNVQGEPEEKKGFFARIFGFLGFGN